jgi:Right handed beta helix region
MVPRGHAEQWNRCDLVDRGWEWTADAANIKTRGINTSHTYVHDREWQHGIAVRGASNVTINRYTSLEVGGDGVAIEGDAGGNPAHTVRVTNADIRHAGRQGVFVANVDGLQVDHAYIDATGYGVGVDIEPDRGTDREYNITIGSDVTVESNRLGAVRISGPTPGAASVRRVFKNITVTDVRELQCPSGSPSISIRNEAGYLGDDLRVTHNRVLNDGQAIQLRPNVWNNVDIRTGNQTKPCGSTW